MIIMTTFLSYGPSQTRHIHMTVLKREQRTCCHDHNRFSESNFHRVLFDSRRFRFSSPLFLMPHLVFIAVPFTFLYLPTTPQVSTLFHSRSATVQRNIIE